MSRRTFRPFAWPKAAVPICAVIAVVAATLWTSCDDDQSEGGLDEYFLRDVAAMQAMGLPVYWLGTEFTADGHVFRGPYVSEFGAEVEAGGIQMDYVTAIDGANIGPVLTIYSRDAWDLVKDGIVGSRAPGVTRSAVSVADRDGELVLQAAGARPLNAMWLILDLDEVVVVARVSSVIAPAARGGGELNPFVNNPDLLIQVMEGLRPYPE